MGLLRVLTLGLALGADAFSFSVALGTRRLKTKLIFKLTLLIGSFHVLMSFLGINLGQLLHLFFDQYYFATTIDKISRLIGGGVLVILGMIMIHDRMIKINKQPQKFKLYGLALLVLTLGVSFDALSVGVSLSMLQINGFKTCLGLGIITAFMVLIGLLLGGRLTNIIDKAEIAGGIVLILLGFRFILLF